MDFIKRIFGNSGDDEAQTSVIQRAEYKDAKHFTKLLKQRDADIAQSLAINEQLQREAKIEPFNYWNVAMDILDKFYISYSAGHSISVCKELYMQSASWYKKGWDSSAPYADMLDMVALGYLLDVPDSTFQDIVDYIKNADSGSDDDQWHPDAILWFIINSRKEFGITSDKVLWTKQYQSLYDITKMPKPEAELAMKDYLDQWYGLHKNDPWYDNHKKDLVYKGYWSWEAAAITKMMNLEDSSFRDHPNYPYDMVHWDGES